MTGRALPAVTFRDLIRSEISKQMREVDQISMGVVSDVEDLEVLLDGMTVAVPVAWAASEVPVLGARVVCVALRGGQQWLVTGTVNGGSGLFLPLAGGEMSGDILLPNNIDLVFGNARATMRHTTDFDDRLVIDSLDALWMQADAGFAFLVGPTNNPAYLKGDEIRYTTPGADTFEKGDFPGLRAVIVHCQGGGGGSGGIAATTAANSSAGRGGGGGGYARSTILVSDLDAVEAVTVGDAGAAGDATPGNGGDGGDSVFDTISGEVRGEGGEGGILGGASSAVGAGTEVAQPGSGTGDIVIRGQLGIAILRLVATSVNAGAGGSSFMGVGGPAIANAVGAATGGNSGGNYGGGAGGRSQGGAILGAKAGSPGGQGIVIVELLY